MINIPEHPVRKEYAQLAREYEDRWGFYAEATLQGALEKSLLDTLLAGIDPTQEMIDIVSKRLSKKVHIGQSWAEKLPFEAETFDLIVSCSMFHYIREPMVVLKEALHVLKPTGRVVITD